MNNVYSVGQINSYIKNMFAQDFMLRSIYIKGEASNVKYHSSGHIYFTMKDKSGSITCIMFAGNRAGLRFQLKEGQQIIVGGSIEVYERDGKYQLYAREITLDGMGLLYERYEQMKREFEEMGMFAAEYKQPIPKYAERIGVVTAPTGAAIRDIIHISNRRNPYIQIILYPALVQGEGAATSIANGIHALEQMCVDVIIVGRGGGSIEDLWAFNEEIVARAIFECSIPIISAVGHETDTTIADYVADLRAPTPSAAAELAVYSIADFEQRYMEYYNTMNHRLRMKLSLYRSKLNELQLRMNYGSPMSRISNKRMYASELESRLHEAMKNSLQIQKHRLELYIERMKGLSPLDKLNQGLTFVTDAEGKPVADIDKVDLDQKLILQMKNGQITTIVIDKEAIRRESLS